MYQSLSGKNWKNLANLEMVLIPFSVLRVDDTLGLVLISPGAHEEPLERNRFGKDYVTVPDGYT